MPVTVVSTLRPLEPTRIEFHTSDLNTTWMRLAQHPEAIPFASARTGTNPLMGPPPPRVFENGPGAPPEDQGWRQMFSPVINPFLQTVENCFNGHLPLAISPDHIWTLIAQGFADHVRKNAEELRSRFVNFQGKTELEIWRLDWIDAYSPDNDWQGVFTEFCQKIAEHIGEHQRKLVVSDFSTTGPVEAAVSEVVLMDAMSEYFSYSVRTCCGIPTITLLGTREDWVSIRSRTLVLAEYGLSWWTDRVIPILDRFVAAFDGNSDPKFWQDIFHIDGGSGGPFLSGWVQNFFPYIGKRKNDFNGNSNPSDFPQGITVVPFKLDGRPMEFTAGFVGSEQDPVTKALTSVMGWAMRAPVKERSDRGYPVPAPPQEAKSGNGPVPAGYAYIVMEPEFVGKILTRLDTLPADTPGKPIGWTVKQRIGIGRRSK